MKKNKFIFAIIILVMSISVYIYYSKKSNTEISFAINHHKDRTTYTTSDEYSLFNVANTKRHFFTSIMKDETMLGKVLQVDKKDGETKQIYDTKFKGGGVRNITANDQYVIWLDNNGVDYLNELVIYDIKKEKVIKTYKDSEKRNINAAFIKNQTIYWIEEDNTKIVNQEPSNNESDTMKLGTYSATIIGYDIVTGNQKKIDTIQTVHYPNESLCFSENKMWYIDNRKYDDKAIIKNLDLKSGKLETYKTQFQFIGHLKPVDDEIVAFFEYTIHNSPEGLLLLNTESNKIKLLDANEDDTGAGYDGKGLIFSQNKTYKISSFNKRKFNDEIQMKNEEDLLVVTNGPLYGLEFVTKQKNSIHPNQIVDWHVENLNWKE
ncbi:hypothetical protein ACQKM9_19645 [Viridibacillus sp. NPDC093762]|uniref:hypothetical protein n=1 Tax=Viridibacillus sp. NPDC093762 TaxID=3390720 RepID=UPI003D03BCC3